MSVMSLLHTDRHAAAPALAAAGWKPRKVPGQDERRDGETQTPKG